MKPPIFVCDIQALSVLLVPSLKTLSSMSLHSSLPVRLTFVRRCEMSSHGDGDDSNQTS